MDKIMDHRLSLQYLFHLKTIEYGKKESLEELKTLKREIAALKNDITALGKPKDCGIYPEAPVHWKNTARFKLLIFTLISTILFGGTLYYKRKPLWIVLAIIVLSLIVLIKKDSEEYNIRFNFYQNELKKYNTRCEQERQRMLAEISLKNEKIKLWEEKQEQLNRSATMLDKINEVRGLLYSINIIPYQFRNLESIGFFYNQVQSSTINLTDLVLYETERVKLGYKNIPSFIKAKEYHLALYTIKQSYFWDSCVLVMERMNEKDKEFAENTGNNLLDRLQELIAVIAKEGLGVKYQINGPVGVVGDNSYMVGSIVTGEVESVISSKKKDPMEEYALIDAETEKKIIDHICSELLEKLVEMGLESDQITSKRYIELKDQMPIKQGETTHTWIERIENAVQNFANFAGIASFALDLLSHLP